MIYSAKQQFAIAVSLCLLFQTTFVHGDGQYIQNGQRKNRQLQWPYHHHTARQAVVPTTATEFDDIPAITAAIIGLTSSILIFDNLRVRFVDLRRRINDITDRQNDLILRVFPVCEAILAAGQETPVSIAGNPVANANKLNALIGHFDDVMTYPEYTRQETSVDYYHGPYRYQNAQLAPRQSRQATAADFTGLSMVAAAAVGVGTGLLVHNVLTQKMNQLDEVVRDQRVALGTLTASLSNTQVVCNAVRQAGLVTPLTGPSSAPNNAIAINGLLTALGGVTMCTS